MAGQRMKSLQVLEKRARRYMQENVSSKKYPNATTYHMSEHKLQVQATTNNHVYCPALYDPQALHPYVTGLGDLM